jgi:hypothetical protein
MGSCSAGIYAEYNPFARAPIAGLSLALSYFAIEPMIEHRFNRLGHALASDARCRQAITGVA